MARKTGNEREHRRGLVLGLSLAEVMLLLLFLVLLGFGKLFSDKVHEADNLLREKNEAVAAVEKLRAANESLAPLIEALKRREPNANRNLDELATRLGRIEASERALKATEAERDALRSQLIELSGGEIVSDTQRQNTAALMKAAKKIDPQDPPAVLRRALTLLQNIGPKTQIEDIKNAEELARSNAELQEKVAVLEERERFRKERAKTGRGIDYPPCWILDGKAQFILDISITDSGFSVRDVSQPNRSQDPAWKLLEDLRRETIVSREDFVKGGSPLFKWSVKNECRFYVYVRDETGADKKYWKMMLRQVETFFYKAERRSSAEASKSSPGQ